MVVLPYQSDGSFLRKDVCHQAWFLKFVLSVAYFPVTVLKNNKRANTMTKFHSKYYVNNNFYEQIWFFEVTYKNVTKMQCQDDGGENEKVEVQENCISNAIVRWPTIILYSLFESPGLFYLYKVLEIKVVRENKCDICNHAVCKSEKFIVGQYYGKPNDVKRFIHCKSIKPQMYMLLLHMDVPSVQTDDAWAFPHHNIFSLQTAFIVKVYFSKMICRYISYNKYIYIRRVLIVHILRLSGFNFHPHNISTYFKRNLFVTRFLFKKKF